MFSAIGAIVGTSGSLVAGIYIILRYPDNVQKWLGIIIGWFSYLFKKGDYISTKLEIQAKLNLFAGSIETEDGVPYNRLSLKWTARDEDEEILFEDGQTILVLRDRSHKNKNFVHAAYFYTSQILLRNAKRRLPKHFKTAIDLYVTQRIIKDQNTAALQQFITDYVVPITDRDRKVRVDISRLKQIDCAGLLFTVLIKELMYLGYKVFLAPSTIAKIVAEVENLMLFLEAWASRVVGDDRTQEDFYGEYTQCSIKIVATKQTREQDKVENQKLRVLEAFEGGCQSVYMIGPGFKEAREFLDKVVRSILTFKNDLQVVQKRTFLSDIHTSPSDKKTVETYVVQIRSPKNVGHIH